MTLTQAVLARPGLENLPVLGVLPRLAEHFAKDLGTCALEAPPGSGKTILAPLWLWENAFSSGQVLVLVPRRVNARLPYLFLEPTCGLVVGYRIRFENRWSEERTKVGYLTYGTALRALADRPPGASGLVIFDEFHERPWEADLLLATLRSLPAARRPRILIMSATLDGASIPEGTPVVTSDGRLHPVEVAWEKAEPMLLSRPRGVGDLIAQRSAELYAEESGEQLIFLPGLATIRQVESVLKADRLPGAIDILHSSLPEAEIRRVVERPSAAGFRRILSTDIAESSVTLPGVTTVIDAGLQRRPRRDAFGLGITLETVRAPRSSLSQRAGRAGRLGPGRCHRLLTRQDELARGGFGRPEILEVDGKTLAMHLASLGFLDRWADLAWLVAPSDVALRDAVDWLERHDLVEGSKLNERGLKVLRSACSPRAGLLGLLASEAGWPIGKVVDWVYAAESGPGRSEGPAHSLPITELLRDRRWTAERDGRLLDRLRDTFATVRPQRAALSEDAVVLRAFDDTLIALRGDRAVARNSAAEAVGLRSTHTTEGYAALLGTAPSGRDGPGSVATLYHEIPVETVWEELLDEIEETATLMWEPKAKTVKEIRRTTLGALVLEESTVYPPAGPKVGSMLAAELGSEDFGEEHAAFMRRLTLFCEARPDLEIDPAALVRGYLETITRWSKAASGEMKEHIKLHLGYATLKALEAALPSSMVLPRRARPLTVHYPEQGAPYIASKLQDFFGWTPPRLLGGKIVLAVHLLAPSGRPVQITQDLEGFWKGSYLQVRKDMRGRYPKHAWPEDPSKESG